MKCNEYMKRKESKKSHISKIKKKNQGKRTVSKANDFFLNHFSFLCSFLLSFFHSFFFRLRLKAEDIHQERAEEQKEDEKRFTREMKTGKRKKRQENTHT